MIVAVTMPNKQASVFQMGVQENETNDIRKPLSLFSLTPQAEADVDVDGTLAGPGLESDLENVAGCRSGSVEKPKQETAGASCSSTTSLVVGWLCWAKSGFEGCPWRQHGPR